MDIDTLYRQMEHMKPAEGLEHIARLFPGKVVFSTSLGQEDQVITQMMATAGLDIKIFTLDTGRLFPETLDLWAITEARYKIGIKPYYPDAAALEDLVSRTGINGFYDSVENRKNCCYVRKVAPLKRALAGNKVWITGLRAKQSSGRSELKLLEWDETNNIIKYNPLIHWTYDQVRTYIHSHTIPYNPLHDNGFISIGCAPCTRAVLPGEDPRVGRWWWEDAHKECGLHIKQAQL